MAWDKVHCSNVQVNIIQGGSSEDNNFQIINSQEPRTDDVGCSDDAEADDSDKIDDANANEDNEAKDFSVYGLVITTLIFI
jgi:hypothetical protein